MKYQSVSAFEKHLEQAAKVQLSSVFLIVSSCSYERKKIVEKVLSAIRSKEGDCSFRFIDGGESDVEECIADWNTRSLLGGKQLFYFDPCDKLKKNELASLAAYVAHPSPFAYVILGANSSKGLTEVYAKGKKELISCDLSDEKPWDRKDRLKRSLSDLMQKAGKRIQAEALDYLLENVGADLPGLEQEAEKLLIYAGERKEIGIEDVRKLCAAQKELTLWQLAEGIVWQQMPPKIDEDLELFDLLPLIAQMRTQLQQGLSLSVLLESRQAAGEITHYFPNLRPAAIDKMTPICKKWKSPFFKRALSALFDLEVLAKNSSLEAVLILDVFLSKLSLLKR